MPCCRALDSLHPRTSGNFGFPDGFVSAAECFGAKVLKGPPRARRGRRGLYPVLDKSL
ncbi:hypothetical protein CBM2599_A160055 [Cupriavidus taiwanensis]|nr:hypothetical protein CBM2599_A160055 [Cupriavidus taiwanensis]SOY84841.1 hypothetical protein CBM2600_A140313 [Cupriavidus taiwanensis]